ncbi:ATP-binding cassette domain-containing protein [Chitinophaga oryziterrae]|uniref:ATP-binding cassette domain-containing protein n=1 Tax=Chitinophaga oryziterrae TaxID=1031224 RepID=A0A6N8JG30_9BACT|nr:peptidase domain-containing ABC transporter [Chitinophaga oryziterrae]MVT43309.1 ATP-binding cassette domain-containing protein [Chitinophaga oryziterrae]
MIKFTRQHDAMDCAPTCLKMITDHYGKNYSLEYLRELCFLSREGVSLLSINDAATALGFRTLMVKTSYEKLVKDCPLPCILHWNQEHFVLLTDIKKKSGWLSRALNLSAPEDRLIVADPAYGIVTLDKETFQKAWVSTATGRGVLLLLEPTPDFYSKETAGNSKGGYGFLFRYLVPYKRFIFQLFIGMVCASIISLIFPFLTQLLVDTGVAEKDISFVYIILLSQLFLFFGTTAIDWIRSWLLLHINTRISLNIISDFLIKLLKLPIKYFDTKAVGDISQRITDHHRIENFLTGSVLSSFFSVINILVFSFILSYYDIRILAVFLTLSIMGILWIFLFQKKRKEFDYRRFARNRESQDKLYEMITGMQEIKLYGSETSKRWEWEQLQANYFKLNVKGLALEQYQQSGLIFFTHLKNILVTFIAAQGVIEGRLTLGALLSVAYIIGQTNSPIEQLVNFIKAAQDAKLSIDRLQEIISKDEEEKPGYHEIKPHELVNEDIHINDLSFQYEGPNSPFVLKDVSFTIPKGKITAIVGTSGSGKTTLMKLLLNFYDPVKGEIRIGDIDLKDISPKSWRKYCGTVMQDGYIFYDTIARNIAVDGNEIDESKMEMAVYIANLKETISRFPSGYTTKIGVSGQGISGGQRQRILIARAVYKNPDYLFFDEATSSLDANNEKVIMDNLDDFFRGKTVVVIAHRLSTVKNADQIIVLENGRIAETGTHDSLTSGKGKYFELVRNQLELGK